MASNTAQVLQSALALSAEERARVARELIDSLDDEVDDGDVEQLWLDEIARRVRSLDEGSATTTPASEALARIRQRLRGSES